MLLYLRSLLLLVMLLRLCLRTLLLLAMLLRLCLRALLLLTMLLRLCLSALLLLTMLLRNAASRNYRSDRPACLDRSRRSKNGGTPVIDGGELLVVLCCRLLVL